MSNEPQTEHVVDIEIHIGPSVQGSYSVTITLDGGQEFRGRLWDDVLSWTPSNVPTKDGKWLFEKLFADNELSAAWGTARERSTQRRVRLYIDPDAQELHTLPWELLQKTYNPLAAQAKTPFSRYLPIDVPWGELVQERPVRMLVVVSAPSDLESKYGLDPVNAPLERENLEKALENVAPDQLQVDFLPLPATLEKLDVALQSGYHVLHFVGHGGFSSRKEHAALYLQDEAGQAVRVLDHELVGLLDRLIRPPWLVCLVACQSAARSATDAFVGLGPMLVSIGVPAVVAMQDLVTIETARKFSTRFYERLLEHGTVDLAVNEARGALLTARHQDASVPVLFMRLRDGQLFQTTTPSAPPQDEAREPSAFSLDKILADYVRNGAPSDLDHRRHLYTILSSEFSAEEIKSLCFELGLDYDDLTGSGRSGKARELITYLERRREIDRLIKAIYQQRPNAPWDLPA